MSKNEKLDVGTNLKKEMIDADQSVKIVLDVNEYLFYPDVLFIENEIFLDTKLVGKIEVRNNVSSMEVISTINTRALEKGMHAYIKKKVKAYYDDKFEDEYINYTMLFDYRIEDEIREQEQEANAKAARKFLTDKKREQGDTASFPIGMFQLDVNRNKESNHLAYMKRALKSYNDYDLNNTKYWLDQAHQTGIKGGEYFWLLGWWCFENGKD